MKYRVGFYAVYEEPDILIYFWDGEKLKFCDEDGFWQESFCQSLQSLHYIIGESLEYLGC